MKGFSVHTFSRPALPGNRPSAANAAQPPRQPYRLMLRLLTGICLLLAALFACREVPPLFRTRLDSDSSARLLGYLLSRAPAALWLWQSVALLLYAASVWMLISVAYRGQRWMPRLGMLAIALAMEPLYRDLREFGVQWLALFSIAVSFLLHHRKSSFGAGFMLAVAVLIQPCALAAPVYFLWRRQFKYALSALALAALMIFASWLLYGIPLLTFDPVSLQGYLSSFASPWHSAGVYSSVAIIIAALDPVLLVLLITSLPYTEGSTRNRLDYMLACLCIAWFTPAHTGGDLLLLLACYLMMGGIVAEKYVEATASLRFAAPERWAAVFAALSYLALIAAATVPSTRLELFSSFFAVKLLMVPAGVLAWKLGRVQSSRTIRLSDYRLRRDAS